GVSLFTSLSSPCLTLRVQRLVPLAEFGSLPLCRLARGANSGGSPIAMFIQRNHQVAGDVALTELRNNCEIISQCSWFHFAPPRACAMCWGLSKTPRAAKATRGAEGERCWVRVSQNAVVACVAKRPV